jgi:hypothetical protein
LYKYIKRDREILIRENIRTAQDRNDLFNRRFGRAHNNTVFLQRTRMHKVQLTHTEIGVETTLLCVRLTTRLLSVIRRKRLTTQSK